MQIRLPITNYSIVWHLPPLADPGPCRLSIQLALLSSFNCLSNLPATSLRRAASLAWGEIIEAVSARSRQARRTLQIPPWKGHPGRSWSNLVGKHLAAPDVFFSCGHELCWSKPTIESSNFYWFGQHSWRWFVVLATRLCYYRDIFENMGTALQESKENRLVI